jgi:hypothetical protein
MSNRVDLPLGNNSFYPPRPKNKTLVEAVFSRSDP